MLYSIFHYFYLYVFSTEDFIDYGKTGIIHEYIGEQ